MYWTQGLHRSLQQHPGAPATIFGDRVRTFAEQANRVSRLAGALRRLGVHSGERVAVLALNSDRFAELLLAVPWANGAITPLSPTWGPAEITYALAHSGTETLFVDDTFAEAARDANARTIVHLGDDAPPAEMLSFEDLIAHSAPIEDARRGGDDLAALLYTGGTTGEPKGVMLSHNALFGSALALEATTPSDMAHARFLVATSMTHASGLFTSLLQTVYGATLVPVPKVEPTAILQAIEQHRAANMFLVPSMLQTLLDHPTVAHTDLSSIQNVVYGAAPITEELLERAMKAFGSASFLQVYGATEMACAGTLLIPEDHDKGSKLRSAGRPMLNIEIRIEDEDGHDVPPGTVGEIVARGDLMLGYWKDPDETAKALRNGWLHTGDVGYLDEEGYLYIVDRARDMIIVGGRNVYSAEVEKALASHAAVAASAVIAVPDDTSGERVHAVIVPANGATPDLDDLQQHCRGLIADYKLPRSIELIDSLPLSPIGKPLKRELRKPHWAGQERQVH